MRGIFGEIDKLLRGQYTQREDLRQGRITIRARTLLSGSALLGVAYGLFMGLYGALRPEMPSLGQLFASAVKVPLLFLLTLAVTFPSLYVFSALAGSRLRFAETLKFLLAGIVINLTLLASLGPVTGFFTLSTESYAFMVVLNVLFYAVAGGAGLVFVFRALGAAIDLRDDEASIPSPASGESAEPVAETGSESEESDSSGAQAGTISPQAETPSAPVPRDQRPPTSRRPVSIGRKRSDRARGIFTVWTFVYGVVGAQMGWILRPFVGAPDREFSFFREREMSFFEGFFNALRNLFE